MSQDEVLRTRKPEKMSIFIRKKHAVLKNTIHKIAAYLISATSVSTSSFNIPAAYFYCWSHRPDALLAASLKLDNKNKKN